MAAGGHLGIAIGAVALVAAAVIGRRGGALIDDSPMGDWPLLPADFSEVTAPGANSRGGEGFGPGTVNAQHETFTLHLGTDV